MNASLRKQLTVYKTSNVSRRLLRRTEALNKANEDKIRLNNKIDALQGEVNTMHKMNHSLTETIRYQKAKRLALTQQSGELLTESSALAKANELLQNQLEEVMANDRISLFADGRYTDATRLVVYELLSKGVGSRQAPSYRLFSVDL